MKFPWTKSPSLPTKRTASTPVATRSIGEMYSGLAGGSNIERMKHRWWWAVLQNPDNKVQTVLAKSREYSRLLHDLDPYMAKYRALLGVYVVGEDGLRMEPQLGDFDKRSRAKVIANIKTHWKAWSKVADVSGRLTWTDIEKLVLQNVARDGEIFVRFVVGRTINKYGFALQLIDPVLLDETYDSIDNVSGNRIIQGVELDTYNRAVAYHFWTSYQDDRFPKKDRKRERVDASEVIHLYEPANSQQARGVPWTSNVILFFARFHEYMDSTLQAAQMASNIPVIIKTTEARAVDWQDDPTATNPIDSTGNNQGTAESNGSGTNANILAALGFQSAGNPYANVNGVTFMELPPNKEAIVPNWNIPNQNFKTSTEVWLHAIATGLHVSYDSLTSDGGNTNYSSGRLNSIVERDVWQSRSAWLVRNFHEKVYAKFIEVQTNMPKAPLQLPTSNSDDFLDVVFLPVSFDWVDPLKDIKMWVEARNMNWVSDTYVSNQLGVNYAETLQQIADDTVRRDALGVAPPLAMTPLQVDTAVETHTDKTGNAADTSLGDTTVNEHTSSTDGTEQQNI